MWCLLYYVPGLFNDAVNNTGYMASVLESLVSNELEYNLRGRKLVVA
jgi:hypothetical protein